MSLRTDPATYHNAVIAILLLLLSSALAPRFQILTLFSFGIAIAATIFTIPAIRRVESYAVPLLIFLIYAIVSGLVVGGVSVSDLFSLEFYDGDGRIFVTYMPILLLSTIRFGESDLKVLIHFLTIISASIVVAAIFWLSGTDQHAFGDYRFLWLQTHHTGAGTLFGMLCILFLLMGIRQKNWFYKILAICLFVMIFFTTSRQAIISVLIAVVALWFRGKRALVGIVAAGLVMGILLPRVAPDTYERLSQVVSKETFQDIRAQLKTESWTPEAGIEGYLVGDEWNILARVLFYIRATELFMDSPIMGAGFGRFNDRHLKFVGQEGVLRVGVDGERVFNSRSAHNSYLHILAENGLVGLFLLLNFWAGLVKRVGERRAACETAGRRDLAAVCEAVQYMTVPMFVGAFFGHALATPSFGILVLVLAGMLARFRPDEEKTRTGPPAFRRLRFPGTVLG